MIDASEYKVSRRIERGRIVIDRFKTSLEENLMPESRDFFAKRFEVRRLRAACSR